MWNNFYNDSTIYLNPRNKTFALTPSTPGGGLVGGLPEPKINKVALAVGGPAPNCN